MLASNQLRKAIDLCIRGARLGRKHPDHIRHDMRGPSVYVRVCVLCVHLKVIAFIACDQSCFAFACHFLLMSLTTLYDPLLSLWKPSNGRRWHCAYFEEGLPIFALLSAIACCINVMLSLLPYSSVVKWGMGDVCAGLTDGTTRSEGSFTTVPAYVSWTCHFVLMKIDCYQSFCIQTVQGICATPYLIQQGMVCTKKCTICALSK